ncbi:MAG: CocE/NonD family hydrolase [Defluviitaleaceae bacterium]|nr:CocE/NonD family hydrolase [Defluviitaleaceae bacterium]
MDRFNIYFSGVKIGSCVLGAANQTFAVKNLYTGEFGEDKEFLKLIGLEIEEVLDNFPQYQSVFAQAGEGVTFTAPWGADYRKEGNALYYRNSKRAFDIHFDGGEPYMMVTMNIVNVIALVREGMEHKTFLAQRAQYDLPGGDYLVSEAEKYMVEMRDGIKLSTFVWLPKNAEWPLKTILARTPYNAVNYVRYLMPYICRGYAVVVQDVRGRNGSEGDYADADDMKDGSDALDWIAKQPWSDGYIGMIGGSAGGAVQWKIAATGNRHLKCMCSFVTAGPGFIDVPRPGGTLLSGALPHMVTMNAQNRDSVNWDEIMEMRPLGDLPMKLFGREDKSWSYMLENEVYNDYWKKSDWTAHEITTPALIAGGWFDDDHKGSMAAWDIVRHYPKENRYLMMGAWMHGSNTARDVHAVSLGNSALRYDVDLYWLRWFEYHLKGKDMGFDRQKGVEYYMMGAEEWRSSSQFPPEDFAKTELFFDENGMLSRSVPKSCGSAEYVYDPKNPAPHLIDPLENELAVPGDYTDVEKRPDVVCFTLPVTRDFEVAGPVTAEFYASSSARDTDWVVRVTEVNPEGRSIQRCYGVFRAKFHQGFDRISLLTPGEPVKFTVKLGQFAARFKQGSSLRVHITSSAKNLIMPNYNTGLAIKDEIDPVTARQTVLFGNGHPSKVILYSKEL